MPHELERHCAVQVGDKTFIAGFYICNIKMCTCNNIIFKGGFNGTHSNEVYVYDWTIKEWSTKPSLKVERYDHACGLHVEDGKPYIVVAGEC